MGGATDEVIAGGAGCTGCGAPLAESVKFCTSCGAARGEAARPDSPPPVAEPESSGPPPPPHVVAPAPPEPDASALLGQVVVFRSMARRDRTLFAEPSATAPPLPGYLMGRCTVAETAGGWARIEHSSGTTGWVPAANLRPHGMPRASTPSPSPAAPAPAATPQDPTAPTAPAEHETSPAPPRGTAIVEALERLHALHAMGGLTDDEFARAKEAMLADGQS